MIYRGNTIPANYNKVAEFSDNYIIYVREDTLYSDRYYDAYIQYIKPSYYVIKINNYTIKKGINYTMTPNYTNNGIYNYIENYDITFEQKTEELTSGDDYTSNTAYLPDYNEINISLFCLLIVIIWVFNQISKLWFKGGCFK